jgi:hypothetical protein
MNDERGRMNENSSLTMKILIAIKTCHRYRDRAAAQRGTWIPRLAAAIPPGWTVDLRFFLGTAIKAGDHRSPLQDEVFLDCDDSYHGLTEKFRGICRWALESGYDYLFNCDDDVYIVPDRLLASLDSRLRGNDGGALDYSGRLRGPMGGFPAPFASGFATWLSRRAFQILAEAPLGKDRRDDRWIGNVLWEHGIRCHRETRFVLVRSSKNTPCAKDGARADNSVIAACEFGPEQMRNEHQAFLHGAPSRARTFPMPSDTPFSSVAVMINTFLRDGFLLKMLRDIESRLPGMQIVVIDDGYDSRKKIKVYSELARRGHICDWLGFNSPPRQRLDAALRFLDRPYTLAASDDLDFAGPGVASGILKMLATLDAHPEINAVAGMVDGKPREGFILMRTGLLAYLPPGDADECPGVNINRQRDPAARAGNHRDWAKYRRRANDLLNI